MIHVNNIEQYTKFINGDAVVKFTADWCGPCKKLAPFFTKLSEEFSDKCVFLEVNIDKNDDIAKRESIRGIPLIRFFSNGKLNEELSFSGNNSDKLIANVKQFVKLIDERVITNFGKLEITSDDEEESEVSSLSSDTDDDKF